MFWIIWILGIVVSYIGLSAILDFDQDKQYWKQEGKSSYNTHPWETFQQRKITSLIALIIPVVNIAYTVVYCLLNIISYALLENIPDKDKNPLDIFWRIGAGKESEIEDDSEEGID